MVSDAGMIIVKTALLFFGVVGSFGNANIILATYLRKTLQSKCGLLLAIHAFGNLICLLFEMLSAVRLITNTSEMMRSQCFWSISVYLYIENIQSYTLLAVGIDRLIAICYPLKYMMWHMKLYMSLLLSPGIIYSASLVTIGALKLNNETIPVCNPPLGYPPLISVIWNHGSMVICFCTVVCYALIYVMLFKIVPAKTTDSSVIAQINIQKVVVKTVIINVLVYFVSELFAVLILFVVRPFCINEELIAEIETYAVIPKLLSYSVDYYVYFWRSTEYRRAFKQQLRPGRKCQSRVVTFNISGL